MSLPRRPSVGLPANPRARASVAGPVRQDYPPRPRSSASERPPPSRYPISPPPLPTQARGLRPQRSVGGLPARPSGSVRSRSLDRRAEPRYASSRREVPPPLPTLPSLPRGPRVGTATQVRGNAPVRGPTQSADYKAPRRREEPVSDDSSSGGSEGFVRSPDSIASSRTSMDEMDMDEKRDEKPPAGFGSSLWSSITGVASNLTINVSKALSSNIASFNGEETPVGGESRITRAMKAYHIEKAQDPMDLPDWLFDERERGVRKRQPTTTAPAGAPEKTAFQGKEPSRPSDLSRSVTTARRDAYDLPPRTTRGPTLADRQAGTAPSVARAGGDAHVTKSISRLRELRDMKRGAKVHFGGDGVEAEDPREYRDEAARAPVPAPTPSRPREPILISSPSPSSGAAAATAAARGAPPTKPRGNMALPLGASLGVRGRQPSTRVGLPTGVRPVRA